MDSPKVISDTQARRIASEWHAPGTALSAFSHTGMIDDLTTDEVQAEIDALMDGPDCTPEEAASSLEDLAALQYYLWEAGHRTPVAGWSSLRF